MNQLKISLTCLLFFALPIYASLPQQRDDWNSNRSSNQCPIINVSISNSKLHIEIIEPTKPTSFKADLPLPLNAKLPLSENHAHDCISELQTRLPLYLQQVLFNALTKEVLRSIET